MALLFDEILVAALSGQGIGASFAPWFYENDEPMLRAIAVKIDNVMEMLDADFKGNVHQIINPPKCIPPFKYTFMDSYARNINMIKVGRMGVHVTCLSKEEDLLDLWVKIVVSPRMTKEINYSSIEDMGAKHALLFTFLESRKKVMGNAPAGIITRSPSHVCFLDKDGNRIEDSGIWLRTSKDMDDEYESRKINLRSKAHCALFAFSLMNCKNITLKVENAPPQEQRDRIKKTGFPLVTYRTIQVDQTLTKKISYDPVNEANRAFHLCRGHFAHYSDDKPLFGKYVGDFWRPQHVRGKPDNGIIIKNYIV
jgi:hypothetical protein